MQSLHRDGIDGYPLISLWTGTPPHSLAMSTPWPFHILLWIVLLQVASLLYSLLQHVHIYMHACTYICMYTHMHACTYRHMYTHIHACMCIHMNVYTHMCMHITYAHMHACTYTHTMHVHSIKIEIRGNKFDKAYHVHVIHPAISSNWIMVWWYLYCPLLLLILKAISGITSASRCSELQVNLNQYPPLFQGSVWGWRSSEQDVKAVGMYTCNTV